MNDPRRVLLVTGDPTLRSALSCLLSCAPGLALVGELGRAQAVPDWVATNGPDIVLLDWDLHPERVVRGLQRAFPTVAIVALCREDRGAAQADAVVTKVEPPARLLAALRAVVSQRTRAFDYFVQHARKPHSVQRSS